MRIDKSRERLMKQLSSITDEKVKLMVTWIRNRRTRNHKRRQTPRQEFEGHLASMTNKDINEMISETQQKRPGFFTSLIHMPGLALRAVAKLLGWQPTGKGPS